MFQHSSCHFISLSWNDRSVRTPSIMLHCKGAVVGGQHGRNETMLGAFCWGLDNSFACFVLETEETVNSHAGTGFIVSDVMDALF